LPITQSVVTSVAAPRYRGACFSACAVFGGLGTIVSGKLSADISEQTIRGVAGWRIGLVVIGGASIFFSALLGLLMPERTKERDSAKLTLVLQQVRVGRSALDVLTFMASSLKRSLSSYSVLVIVAQCCFYQCIMQTLLYLTMWLQYSGYSDSATGTLIGFWRVGTMLGKLGGGFIGDAFSEASRLHGRQLYGQIVCVSIIPLIAFIFGRTVAAERQSFSHFAGLLFCFGLLGDTWCTGVNRPVLTQVVARSHVASTMAWKMTLDNAMGIVIGPAVLMHLATHFGFSSSHQKVSEMPNEFRAKNAEALGKLIFTVCLLSYFAMALVYTALQWTFAWDLQAAQKESDDDGAWGRGRLGEAESVQKAALEAKRYH
jgi:hypothetical protein